MNLPNAISAFRLFLVPVFAIVYFGNSANSNIYAFIIFLVAGVSDVIDGYIARKYNLVTKLGRIIDPMADKCMVFTALTCTAITGDIYFIFPVLYLLKESYQIYGAIRLAGKISDVPPANFLGKSTTCLFYIAITIAILFPKGFAYSFSILCLGFLTSIISFISYYKRGKKLIATSNLMPKDASDTTIGGN